MTSLRAFRAVLCGVILSGLSACGADTADNDALVRTFEEGDAAKASTQDGQPITFASKPSYCLDIASDDPDNGSAVGLHSCNGSTAQAWNIKDGLIYASGKRCLNVVDGRKKNGATLQIWECNSQDINMQFSYTNKQIKWKGNNKCLDLVDGKVADGAAVQLWDCADGSSNQQWLRTASATPAPAPNNNSTSISSDIPIPVQNYQRIPWDKFRHEVMSQGAVNNEQQAYVKDGSTISINSKNQLVIKAYAKGNKYSWLSGRLTGPQLGTKKGYIEAKMMMPSAKGTWPAFWVMNKDNKPTWPQGGEIDIMEQVNGENRLVVSTHYGKSPSQTKDTSKSINTKNMSHTWHTFGLAWDQSKCSFYMDGAKVHTVNFPSDSPFAAQIPNYTTILNLAIGGNWPKYADDSIGTQYLYFDYVLQSTEVPSGF